MNRFLVLTLLGGAACAGQRPQVLTPVRVDTVATAVTTTPSTPGATAAPSSAVKTTMDDPLARVDAVRGSWTPTDASPESG